MTRPSPALRLPDVGGPFVLTAEHASRRVPAPWSSTPEDEAVLSTHWGWDIGIAGVTRAISQATGSGAVLASFSRLLADVNRDPAHPGFVLSEVEGRPLSFNAGLDEAGRAERARLLHAPYHAAVEALIEERLASGPPPVLLVMHSFTPVWQGEPRTMDLGVICTPDQDPLADRAAAALGELGLRVAHNAPYAAGGGMAYSLERHGPAYGLPHLELEVNQALISEPAAATRLGRELARVLARLAA